MSTPRLQRFDFQHLRDFSAPITVKEVLLAEPAAEEIAPPPPVFTEADMEHAREAGKKLGYAEGFEAGLQQAKGENTAVSRELANTLGRIGDQLATLNSTYQQLVNEQSAELSELVLMIARKVAGEALDARGVETIRALVAACIPMVLSKPRVTLEMSPLMLDHAQGILTEHFTQAGFEGDLIFRTSDSMDESDIRIEWANGQATRNTASLWQDIEALLQQSALAPTLPTTEPLGDTHG